MKLKSKKSALLLSFTSLLLCFAMLAGSTFAWFTDTATTGVNKIKAGNLDIELAYKNSTTGGKFKEANKETPVFDNNAQWEPGHVEYVVLKVSNEGNLALKYKLGINIANEVGSTNVYDNPFNLSDYIRFAVLDGDKTEGSVDRDALVAAATENSKLIKEGYSKEDHLLAGENNSEKTVTLVVWMPTTVDNKANHKTGAAAPSVELGINVVATQLSHESDSFGPDYDKDAPSVTANVADAEGIRAAIQQGETAGVPVKITLTGDVSGADLNGGDVTVNVADKTLTLLYNTPISQGQVTIIGNEGAKLGNTKNVTVTGEGKLTMGIGIGDANAYQATSFKVTDGGTLNITGGTNEHSGSEGKLITATGEGSTVNISGGNFKPSGSQFKLVEAQTGAVVNVTGGTFSCSGEKSVVFYADGGTIIISDCKASKSGGGSQIFQRLNGGKIVVTGGTFSQDPRAYVAEGHNVMNNGNGTWTVQ